MPKLYIAIYRPRQGNYLHWALYLENGNENIIYEVTGSHPIFQRNVLSAKPSSTVRHKKNILVATLRDQDVPHFKKHMETATVDNETTEWNCQDYVLDTLSELYDECIIDEDDKDYNKGKKAADAYWGAQ